MSYLKACLPKIEIYEQLSSELKQRRIKQGKNKINLNTHVIFSSYQKIIRICEEISILSAFIVLKNIFLMITLKIINEN